MMGFFQLDIGHCTNEQIPPNSPTQRFSGFPRNVWDDCLDVFKVMFSFLPNGSINI